MEEVASLCNPIATVEQLSNSSSRLDGIPADLESSLRFLGARLTQAAGILLRLPQNVTAQAVVIFYRFYVGPEGGSFRIDVLKDVSAASTYLAAKLSLNPLAPRSVLNVYAYLVSPASPLQGHPISNTENDPDAYCLSEGSYQTGKTKLSNTEAIILRTLAFSTRVITPHHLALTYLQTLGVSPPQPTERSRSLALRTLAYLNTALLSPQLLYLTHQPSALAVSAIYLAAREVGVPISGLEWWEVFDVDREELGFLTVGLLSSEEWIRQEKEKWSGRNCPLTVEELDTELQIRTAEEEGP